MQFGQGRARVIGVAEPHLELLFPPDVSIHRTPAVWTAEAWTFQLIAHVHLFADDPRVRSGGGRDRHSERSCLEPTGGSTPAIKLGGTILLDEGSFEIVGVMPASFWFPSRGSPDV